MKAYIAEFIDSDGDIIDDLELQLQTRNIEIVTDSSKTHECDYIFVVPAHGANPYNGDCIQVSEELTLFLKRVGPKNVIAAKECNRLFKGVKIDESHLASNYLDVESNKLSYDQLLGKQEDDLVCVNPKPKDTKRVLVTQIGDFNEDVAQELRKKLGQYNVEITYDKDTIDNCDYIFVVPSTNCYDCYSDGDCYTPLSRKLAYYLKDMNFNKVFFIDSHINAFLGERIDLDCEDINGYYLDINTDETLFETLFDQKVETSKNNTDSKKRVFILTSPESNLRLANRLAEILNKYNVQRIYDRPEVNISTCDYIFVVPSENDLETYDDGDCYIETASVIIDTLKHKDLSNVFLVDDHVNLIKVDKLDKLDYCDFLDLDVEEYVSFDKLFNNLTDLEELDKLIATFDDEEEFLNINEKKEYEKALNIIN